jgi:hypothetical protein
VCEAGGQGGLKGEVVGGSGLSPCRIAIAIQETWTRRDSDDWCRVMIAMQGSKAGECDWWERQGYGRGEERDLRSSPKSPEDARDNELAGQLRLTDCGGDGDCSAPKGNCHFYVTCWSIEYLVCLGTSSLYITPTNTTTLVLQGSTYTSSPA